MALSKYVSKLTKFKEKLTGSTNNTSSTDFVVWEKNKHRVDVNFHTNDKVKNLPTLDTFHRITQTLGSHQLAMSNNLYGINHQGVKGIIPENRDSYGLVFFTRPCLNLTSVNLKNVRQFYSLLTENKSSVHRYVRCMLDPRLQNFNKIGLEMVRKEFAYANQTRTVKEIDPATGQANDVTYNGAFKDSDQIKVINEYIKNTDGEDDLSCPLVDNKLGFIPLLTNTIKSLSGWPDLVMPTYTSKEGLKREQWSIADGFIDIYESFDLDCTFRNIKDEPTILMFETWLRYMAMVFEGIMSPYMDMIIENEIDYNTRIYRLVLDESKTFVKKIAACGAAFPVNVPNSKFFDFSDSEKYNQDSKDINIRFKCMGAMYNDDILVHEFNLVTAIFNPDLRDFIAGGYDLKTKKPKNPLPKKYTEIPYNLLHLFNHRGYPIIDKNTLQLKWYINTDSKVYQELYNYYLK